MTTLPVPAEVSHVRVYLDALAMVSTDGTDVDSLPDWTAITGTVTLTPMLASSSVVVTSTGRGFIPLPKTFTLSGGSFEGWVVNSADPDLTPHDWSYRVRLTVTAPSTAIIEGTFTPTSATTEANLLPLLPVSSATGGLVIIPAGVPAGGTTGQALVKASDADFDVEWAAGGTGGVTSVNTKTGAVTLNAADVGADPAGTAAGLVGALVIPDSADDVGAIPEPAVEGASGDVLVTDGAGGRTWATPDAGGVTSVDGQTGAVSLSSTYATKAELATAGGAVTVDDTPAAPAEGESATYFVTSAVSWPAGLEWSTDPDGGVAPTITGTALVSLFTYGGTTRAVLGATFPAASAPADTTAPTWSATFTMGTPTQTSVVATASALATDNVAVTGYEVSYNNGSTYAAITPSGANFTLAGTAGTTYATTKLRARDAAGNRSTALSVPSYTMAASTDTTPPTVGTLAGSAITDDGFTLTATGASDETALHAQPYRFSTDDGSTYSAYQASPIYAASGLDPSTAYTCKHQTRDAADNVSTGPSVTVTTTAAAPTVWASDDFTRADSATTLGTADTGQTWQYVALTGATPVFGISSNSAYKVGPIYVRSTAIVTGLPSANMDVRGTIVAYQGSAYYPGLAARVAAGEAYVLETTSEFHFQVQRVMGGTASALNAATPVNGGWLNKEFRLVVAEEGSDTRVTVYCGGVQCFTGLDTAASRPTATTAGLSIYGTANLTRIDGFSVRPA